MTVFFLSFHFKENAKGGNIALTFTNPIMEKGADPWMYYKDGYYYYTHTTGNNITIWKSKSMTNIGAGEFSVVWTPPHDRPYSFNIWAPHFHFLNGKWYIYFAAGPNYGDFSHQRIWVLESKTEDALGDYVMKGQIKDASDKWAIDGTVIQYDGRMYFAWSGWEGDVNIAQSIYIAPMSNPWTISGNRVLLSKPEYIWEKRGGPPYINEGTRVMYRNDKIHIIYSASGSWTDYYCLGRLTFSGGDILDPKAWVKSKEPVFESSNNVFGPGHASFVKSPDGTEDWIIYHAARFSGSGWDRNVRAQRFIWNDDDTPYFGEPFSEGIPIELPSGELALFEDINRIQEDKIYKIMSRKDDLALELKKEDSHISLMTTKWENQKSQMWKISALENGLVSITSVEYGSVMTLRNDKYEKNEKESETNQLYDITFETYQGSNEQKWGLVFNPSGYVRIVSASTGEKLYVATKGSDIGYPVTLQPNRHLKSDMWKFIEVK